MMLGNSEFRQIVRSSAAVVFDAEIAALQMTKACLDDRFIRSCELIRELSGKLVVTGMGKAGLIGQKISATLRSTGQPSVFLDPAQALHGDMGMIGRGDGILALSNSGRTDEVMAVCAHVRARSIGIVAITGDEASPLGMFAEWAIPYPDVEEGCPIGRAPMSSAVMMLAIGDAIAATLMQSRHFTERDFLALHHGGYLGQAIAA